MAADIPFTIGICAYNEAENIEGSIRSAYSQRLDGFTHAETIVVSGASTDGTDGIVRRLSEEFRSLRLIRQETREGKNSAVNLILDSKSTELIVILNADNSFVDADGLQRLLEPFRDPGVGMVGGHPLPTNDPGSLPGFAAVLFWEMHHRIALRSPRSASWSLTGTSGSGCPRTCSPTRTWSGSIWRVSDTRRCTPRRPGSATAVPRPSPI